MHANHANQERWRQFTLQYPHWALLSQKEVGELWDLFIKTYKDGHFRLPGTFSITGRKTSDK